MRQTESQVGWPPVAPLQLLAREMESLRRSGAVDLSVLGFQTSDSFPSTAGRPCDHPGSALPNSSDTEGLSQVDLRLH